MSGLLPDTSCTIAAVCAWHEHHDRAGREIERRLRQADPMFVAAPALVEAYAVLTRLPAPHRLSARDAVTLLQANFMLGGKVVALDGKAYRALLRGAPGDGIAGGQIYDAVIAACAIRAKGLSENLAWHPVAGRRRLPPAGASTGPNQATRRAPACGVALKEDSGVAPRRGRKRVAAPPGSEGPPGGFGIGSKGAMLLTFNASHFVPFARRELEIVVPGQA